MRIIQRGGNATDGVSSQNFITDQAETHANGSLRSAKPGHIEPNDRSAVFKDW